MHKCTLRITCMHYCTNLLPLWHVNTRRYKGLLMLRKHAIPKWSAGYSSYFSFAVACDSVLSDHKAVVHLTLHGEFNYTGRRYSGIFVPPLDGLFSILGKWNIIRLLKLYRVFDYRCSRIRKSQDDSSKEDYNAFFSALLSWEKWTL